MKSNLSKHIFFFFLLIGAGCCAQSVPVKGSIRVEAGIPASLTNSLFRHTFKGIYSLSLNPSFHIKNRFFIGPVANYRRFKVVPRKLQDVNTTFDQYSVGGRIGYTHFYSDYASMGFALQAQTERGHFFRLACTDKENHKFSSFSYSPQIYVNFLADENFMIGAVVSATFDDYDFDPYSICLQDVRNFTDDEHKDKLVYLNVGFSLVYFFTKGGKTLTPRDHGRGEPAEE